MRSSSGYLLIFLAAVCWGFLGHGGRFAMQEGLTPLEVAFWRAALGCCFFLLHAARSHALKVHSPADLGAFALFGLVSLASFFACYQYAVQNGGAALSSVLLYTAPAWVAVFSRFFFGERFTSAKVTAIAMAMAGVICVSLSGTDVGTVPALPAGLATETGNTSAAGPATAFPLAGVFFGLLSGLLYSTHYIFSKNYLKRYTPFTIYGYSMVFATLGMLPFISRIPSSFTVWAALLFLAFICTYAAYWAYCEGLKRLEPTKAAVLCTLEPVVATAAAWWLWGEHFMGAGWAGAALIIGAVFVLVRAPEKKTSKI